MADPHIAVVLIRAAGRGFPVWTEGANPGAGAARQALSDLCRLVETAEKPVVVALHGLAVGPVLELALAAPARIADAGARIGLPDVTLGLLPGAGTQRLPRLIGAEQALRLLLTGRGISAAEALALGLLDRVVEEALPDAALAMARDLAGRRLTATRDRRDGLRDGLVYQRAVAAARSRLEGSRLPAPGRIVDCVEAAQLLPSSKAWSMRRPPSKISVPRPKRRPCAMCNWPNGLPRGFLRLRWFRACRPAPCAAWAFWVPRPRT
ncbi:enoyl-CoA hydratase/isomerase family protein [Gemmobacter lanyuensis]